MLGEAHRRAERGTDVVVAYAPARGRSPAALLAGLELMPPAKVPFRGTMVKELDLSAVLARRPEVALLEGFAHANPPGSRHATRWQDAEELLQGGIDVVSTVDVRELDSLRDVVEKITGGPDGESLIRRAARLAARSGADLLAVHVARPGGPAGPGLGAPGTRAQLVRSLGGSYHELNDDNIPAALLTFAQAENATQLVLGATRRSWRTALSPRTTIASRVLRGANGIDVHIVTCSPTATNNPLTTPILESPEESGKDRAERARRVPFSRARLRGA
jgi:K+-sensing histidine kinase KdpD